MHCEGPEAHQIRCDLRDERYAGFHRRWPVPKVDGVCKGAQPELHHPLRCCLYRQQEYQAYILSLRESLLEWPTGNWMHYHKWGSTGIAQNISFCRLAHTALNEDISQSECEALSGI